METQPLAPGVPYDPGRRQAFTQMDKALKQTAAALGVKDYENMSAATLMPNYYNGH